MHIRINANVYNVMCIMIYERTECSRELEFEIVCCVVACFRSKLDSDRNLRRTIYYAGIEYLSTYLMFLTQALRK